ncbi:MAG: TlpA disulfide reductase family protein [Planctomycetota bacterium]
MNPVRTSHIQHWVGLLIAGVAFAAVGCDANQRTENIVIAPAPETDVVAANPVQPSPSSPEVTLAVGDAAPDLSLAKFMMGEPTDLANSDRVHVVEFWATWCPPCRAGMPHISELQAKHGDAVAFVGVTREDEETVQTFLAQDSDVEEGKTWGEVIQYRIALDEGSKTNADYMQAAGQNGIPCAFIVGKEGKIEWIGHPMSIDGPLQQVVDGTWDSGSAAL